MNTPNSPFSKVTLDQLAEFARGLEGSDGETFDDLQAQRKAALKRQIEEVIAERKELVQTWIRLDNPSDKTDDWIQGLCIELDRRKYRLEQCLNEM